MNNENIKTAIQLTISDLTAKLNKEFVIISYDSTKGGIPYQYGHDDGKKHAYQDAINQLKEILKKF